jgi:hypothetical protein
VGTFTDAPPKIWKRGGPRRACAAAAGRHGGTGGLGRAGLPGRTHHTRAQAEALLRALVVERFEEVEEDGRTAVRQPKHWHLFHVVARMPGAEPGPLTSGGSPAATSDSSFALSDCWTEDGWDIETSIEICGLASFQAAIQGVYASGVTLAGRVR